MAVAEHFRDQGRHVLFLADSITRFAEAHREIALASGEAPSYRGFPPSTSQTIMSLAERAGLRLPAPVSPSRPVPAGADLRLAGASGLVCVERLHRRDPTTRIVVLTGSVILTASLAAASRATPPKHSFFSSVSASQVESYLLIGSMRL